MNSKSGSIVLLLAAGIIALVFVKLMYDMNSNMAKMTDYVGSLTKDVSTMRASMEEMNTSMKSIDKNIHAMGGAVEQGSQTFKQWNPAQMMR